MPFSPSLSLSLSLSVSNNNITTTMTHTHSINTALPFLIDNDDDLCPPGKGQVSEDVAEKTGSGSGLLSGSRHCLQWHQWIANLCALPSLSMHYTFSQPAILIYHYSLSYPFPFFFPFSFPFNLSHTIHTTLFSLSLSLILFLIDKVSDQVFHSIYLLAIIPSLSLSQNH